MEKIRRIYLIKLLCIKQKTTINETKKTLDKKSTEYTDFVEKEKELKQEEKIGKIK